MPSAATTYIAASCNRGTNVSACRTSDGLVAFGSGRFIGLWNSADESSWGTHATLPGHEGDVMVVKFLESERESSFFVSGDNAGAVRVWKEDNGAWSLHALLPGHSQSVSALALLELPSVSGQDAGFIVVTGSSDGTLHSWIIAASGPVLLQEFSLKGKIPLELTLSFLPSSQSLILAIGSTENRLQLYTSPTSTAEISFSKALSLEGHSDWVRALSFITPLPSDPSSSTSVEYDIKPGEVLLASGSQDNYIRLWRFSRLSQPSAPVQSASNGLDALDELERSLAEVGGGELRVTAHDFSVEGDGHFACSAEAVLLGHDTWITGLHWAPPSASPSEPLRLLSASADRSMILWTPSPGSSSAVWTGTKRFGEFTSQTNLGFFGALWGLGANTVLAHGWQGSWHVWRQEGEGGTMGDWQARVATGGHFGAVKTLAWEPKGEFLISAGDDMTTRLHAPWQRRVGSEEKEVVTWHELGRPQIHGYPVASVTFTDRLQFISGADEKIVRVFDAPRVFLSGLGKLSGVTDVGDEASRPMAASIPPLGLSNRALASMAEADIAPASKDPFDIVLPVNYTVASHPPFEEQLLGATLWPEIEKLYGHGYEIIALASAHSHPIIATACKATSAEHAVIRLYDSTTWKPTGTILEGHALTITNLRFSPDDRWLLSVSRDRSWHVYEKRDGHYVPAGNSKAHARIVWDGCWARDSSWFATASRDKTVKVWSQEGGPEWKCAATLKLEDAATAIASTTLSNPPRHLLAVGLENGHIQLYTAPLADPTSWFPYLLLDSSIAHVRSVTTLSFQPKSGVLRLASGSEDRSVRITDIIE